MLRTTSKPAEFGDSRTIARLTKPIAVLFLSLLMSVSFGQTISKLTLSASSVTGGEKLTGTVTLSAKAQGTGFTVDLPPPGGAANVLAYQTTLTIPGGKTSATFPITTYPTATDFNVNVRAVLPGSGNHDVLSLLLIKAPVISAITVNPNSVTGGTSTSGTVTLTGAAAAGGVVVTLKGTNSTGVVPSTIIVPTGSASVSVPFTTKPVTAITTTTVKGTTGKASASTTFKVIPPTLQAFTINPLSVVGGAHTTGSISLTGPAPAGGTKVLLSSSSKSATVLPYITYGAGTSTGATIDVATSEVTSRTTCKITATVGTASIGITITILPIGIQSFTINPTSVQGGSTATATIALNGKAGTAGFPVKLSSDQSFALVPATKTIAAGLIGSAVTISTSKVATSGVANITLTDPTGVTYKATLTVNPTGAGLANSAWPKFQRDMANSGLGTGKGAVGTVKWKFAAQGGIASSPAIGPDGTIYFGSSDANVYAVNGSTGIVKWKYTTNNILNGSPTLSADGSLYIGSWDGSFYSLDSATGKLKWFFPVNSYVSSGVALAKDGTVIFGCADHNVYAVNPADGTQKWSYQSGAEVVTTPAIGPDGTVYVGSNDKRMVALNGATGAILWSFGTNGSIVSSPTLASDGTLYFGSYDSNLYAVDTASGAKKWAFKLTREIVSSPSIGADGTIYFGCSDSKVYAINSSGTLVWKFTADSEVLTSPSISGDGTIYITSNLGLLYALSPVNGASIWTRQLGTAARSSVAIGSDGTLYVGSSDNYLYAIN